MSHWNCRIIYHDKAKYPWYGVHEVFYNEDNTIWLYTVEALDITGETEKELKEYLDLVVEDANKFPILIESEIICTADNDDEELEKELEGEELKEWLENKKATKIGLVRTRTVYVNKDVDNQEKDLENENLQS